MKNSLIGLAIGLVTGLVGVAAHAGFVDMPILGLAFAVILVATGAWFTIEWFDIAGWFTYLIVIFVVTAFLLLFPHSSDIIVSPTVWVSQAYIVLAPLAAAIPGLLVTRANKKNASQELSVD